MAQRATSFRPRLAERQPVFPALLPLGERLAQKGYLSHAAIPAILKAQNRWGCRFGEAALALGKIAPFELAEALADEHNATFVDLTVDPPDAALCNGMLAQVPQAF